MTHLPLTVRPGDEAPIYRQIMLQIQEAIAQQRLEIGQRLPSHRRLAKDLVIAPLTVKRAYDELERAGWLRSQQGRGTFVASRLETWDQGTAREAIRPQIRRLVHEAQLRGVDLETLHDLLESEARRLEEARQEQLTQEDPT